MAALSIQITRQHGRAISLPRIYIEVPRKDLWLCALIFFAGLALPALMVLEVLAPSLLLGLLGFALTFTGGIAYLVRLGEVG